MSIIKSTTDAIKRFFMSEQISQMEQENIILKRQTKEQSEAIQTIKSQAEQLQQEATHYKKKLIQEKVKHINIELPKIQEQSQQRTSTRVRTL